MDTSGLINEHSKIKLELYRLYLERYLAVLLVAPFFESIIIHDVFAGSGISKNDEKGSAIIATEVINGISTEENPKNKRILLQLNDADESNAAQLKHYLKDCSFASVTNMMADEYIQSWMPQANAHNLFFIDPHGYTQVSIEKLRKLFSRHGNDFLIFIPIYFIYRFLRRSVDAEQLKPIAEFLSAVGVNNDDAERVEDVEGFSELVKEALKRTADTEFVYKQHIKNRDCNSAYALFFITHNILGAEKFLEAKENLSDFIDSKKDQMSFAFVSEEGRPSLLGFMEAGKEYDNLQIYHLGIRLGLLSKHVIKEMRAAEDAEVIQVKPAPQRERNRGGFYIGYQNYKKNERRIIITKVALN